MVQAHTDLSIIYSALYQHKLAIQYAEKALQISVDITNQLNYANVLWRAKRYEDAAQQYQKVISYNDQNIDAYIGLGSTYLALAKLNDALDVLNLAIKVDSENVDAFFNRGVVQSKQGKYDQAISDFQKVLDLQPNYPEVHFQIGYAYHLLISTLSTYRISSYIVLFH